MNYNPLISVIVPVYNVERYLPRCIESILAQTYTNFELILVDDGTPDRSGVICDGYANEDPRIRVIHKENGGVSAARNVGIEEAVGEWITFIDSDDWVSKDYLAVLLSPLDNHECDLTVGALEWRYTVISNNATKERMLTAGKMIGEEDTLGTIAFAGPVYKLFSKKIIDDNNLRFQKGVLKGEDALFCARYLQHCRCVYMTGKVIYYYNWLNASSVTRKDPYFEDRKKWDIQYIEEYDAALMAFGLDDEARSDAVSRKALSGYIDVAGTIVNNLSEEEAKAKIEELFDYYDKWLSRNSGWTLAIKNDRLIALASFVKDKNVQAIYGLLKPKKKTLAQKIKRMIKRAWIPFLEKRRDGLKKSKF